MTQARCWTLACGLALALGLCPAGAQEKSVTKSKAKGCPACAGCPADCCPADCCAGSCADCPKCCPGACEGCTGTAKAVTGCPACGEKAGACCATTKAADAGKGGCCSGACPHADAVTSKNSAAGKSRIEAYLDRGHGIKISVDFTHTPLATALDHLGCAGHLCIVPDTRALGAAGVPVDQPITYHAEGVDPKTAVKAIVKQAHLCCVTHGDTIKVTSSEKSDTPVRRVYAVGDLLVPGVRGNPEDVLIRVITRAVEPSSWERKGGRGTIDFFPLGDALVVTQPPEVQQKVAALLKGLRMFADLVEKRSEAGVTTFVPVPVMGGPLAPPVPPAPFTPQTPGPCVDAFHMMGTVPGMPLQRFGQHPAPCAGVVPEPLAMPRPNECPAPACPACPACPGVKAMSPAVTLPWPPATGPNCIVLQAAASASAPTPPCCWQTLTLKAVTVDGRDKLEIRTCDGTRLTCENLDLSLPGAAGCKVAAGHKQVMISGPFLKAVADTVRRAGGPQDHIILEGHVQLHYQKDGQRAEVTGDQVQIGLAKGSLEIGTKPAKTPDVFTLFTGSNR